MTPAAVREPVVGDLPFVVKALLCVFGLSRARVLTVLIVLPLNMPILKLGVCMVTPRMAGLDLGLWLSLQGAVFAAMLAPGQSCMAMALR